MRCALLYLDALEGAQQRAHAHLPTQKAPDFQMEGGRNLRKFYPAGDAMIYP